MRSKKKAHRATPLPKIKIQLSNRVLRWIGTAALMGILLGAGTYPFLSHKHQRYVQSYALMTLDWLREDSALPDTAIHLLDTLVDCIPFSYEGAVKLDVPPGGTAWTFASPPEGSRRLQYLVNIAYLVGYDNEMRNPAWVSYRVFNPDSHEAPPRPRDFFIDKRTRTKVEPADYSGSGFDRGHMAPNYSIAVCYGREAQVETFLMSNIIPQKPDLNRKIWKHLEKREINRYARRFEEIWVITGPIYKCPQQPDRLPSLVAIPSYCYKILVHNSSYGVRTLAFIIPQAITGDEALQSYLVSIDSIEACTGLDFFSNLPEPIQEALESEPASRMW